MDEREIKKRLEEVYQNITKRVDKDVEKIESHAWADQCKKKKYTENQTSKSIDAISREFYEDVFEGLPKNGNTKEEFRDLIAMKYWAVEFQTRSKKHSELKKEKYGKRAKKQGLVDIAEEIPLLYAEHAGKFSKVPELEEKLLEYSIQEAEGYNVKEERYKCLDELNALMKELTPLKERLGDLQKRLEARKKYARLEYEKDRRNT